MNINFIRNLSDEILRENQQLKTQIIIIKQKLSDYEEEMISTITSIGHSLNELNSPAQMLKEFAGQARKVFSENKLLHQEKNNQQQKIKSLSLQIKMIEQQGLCKESELQIQKQKEEKFKEEKREIYHSFEEERKGLRDNNDQLSKELIELKEQMRLEKLMITEAKRREIEEIRQYHLKEFLEFREKSEKETIFLEKQMQGELNQKAKMIKDLEKAIEKISHNLKLEQNQSDILIKLFKSFQEYNHLSKIIQQRSEEIFKFRQQVQELEYGRIKLQSRVKEITMNQMNLLSQIERANIQKRDLQNKLNLKNLNLLKSEQDKEEMEKYYDRKWNQEFQKVKLQLEKSFTEKIRAIEEDCNEKIDIMSRRVEESSQELHKSQISQKQIEKSLQQACQKAKTLVACVHQLQLKVAEITTSKLQLQKKANEQLFQLKTEISQSKLFYDSQINNLNSLLSVEKEIYDDLQSKHQQEIQTCISDYKLETEKLLSEKQNEKKILENQLEKEISKLKNKLQEKQEFIEDARTNLTKEIEQQYSKKWEFAQKEADMKYREKEEQASKKNDKWMIKFKDVDLKYTLLKKKQEEEQENFRKQISKMETENQLLRTSESKHHSQIKEQMITKNQLLIRISDLEKKITQLSNDLHKDAEEKCSLEDAIQDKSFEISTLKEERKIWLQEISELQKSFKQEFESLKKSHNKHSNILKSKIWQLQEMVKKRPIKRKDYQKMKEMDKERKHLRNEIYIKQAENIILNQVKDYYESKIKQTQNKANQQETGRAGNALMGFKLKMLKKNSHKQAFTEAEQSKQMVEMKKYIVKSAKKSQNLSLSKMKFEDIGRYHRFNTTHE